MASYNKFIGIGNLTKDPELKILTSGTAVCKFNIAINRRYTQQGKTIDETCFVEIVVWGKSAENCKNYLLKGAQVLVEGRLNQESWIDNNGNNRSKLNVVADSVTFLNTKTQSQESVTQESEPMEYPDSDNAEDDDCPF
jgi:single-strand DNA-binding protein